MHRCRVASGMISMSITRSGGTPGADGGSDDKTDRKLSCENSSITSSARSSCGSQLCMRWMFCSMIQPPSSALLRSAEIAICSCPCPMEMLTNLPFASEQPSELAMPSTAGVGSVPGKSTKKNGDKLLDSLYATSMLNGSISINSLPRLSWTNCTNAAPIRSGRRTRRSMSRWKGEMSRNDRGKSALSAFSSWNHLFQPSESCSIFCVKAPEFLNTGIDSSVFSMPHCASRIQLHILRQRTRVLEHRDRLQCLQHAPLRIEDPALAVLRHGWRCRVRRTDLERIRLVPVQSAAPHEDAECEHRRNNELVGREEATGDVEPNEDRDDFRQEVDAVLQVLARQLDNLLFLLLRFGLLGSLPLFAFLALLVLVLVATAFSLLRCSFFDLRLLRFPQGHRLHCARDDNKERIQGVLVEGMDLTEIHHQEENQRSPIGRRAVIL